jgi:hypothetical protein
MQADQAGFQQVLASLVQQSQLLQARSRGGQELLEEQLQLVVQQCLGDAPAEDVAYCMLSIGALQQKGLEQLGAQDVLMVIKRAAAIEQAAQSCQPSRTAAGLLQSLTQVFGGSRPQLSDLARSTGWAAGLLSAVLVLLGLC